MLDPDDEQVIKECRDGGATLVTWDRVLRVAAGGVSPYEALDQAISESPVEGAEGEETRRAEITRLRALSPAELTIMADSADKTWARFHKYIEVRLETARLIRHLRVNKDYSWRAIARFCSEQWHGPWGGSQIAGMVVCDKAAKLLGEDYMAMPWN